MIPTTVYVYGNSKLLNLSMTSGGVYIIIEL